MNGTNLKKIGFTLLIGIAAVILVFRVGPLRKLTGV